MNAVELGEDRDGVRERERECVWEREKTEYVNKERAI